MHTSFTPARRAGAAVLAAGITLGGTTAVDSPAGAAPHASVTVSKTRNLNPNGEWITVSGKNFSGKNFGIYVGLAQDNKYGPTKQGSFGETKWLKPNEIRGGKFTTRIKVKAVSGKINCKVNRCSIRTLSAHGVPDRTQDTKTPVSFRAF